MVMAIQTANLRVSFLRIRVARSVLAATAVAIVVPGAVAYCIGAQVNRELRFFQTGERGR